MTLHEAAPVTSSGTIPLNADATLLEEWDASHANILDDIDDLMCSHPYFISLSSATRMSSIVNAIEFVLSSHEFQKMVIANAPPIAKFNSHLKGVFYGYDFHLSQGTPKLIEINSNAGGGLISAYQANLTKNKIAHFYKHIGSHIRNYSIAEQERMFIHMFLEEWSLFNPDKPLDTIAIMDVNPDQQFLKKEFRLFCRLFRKYGIDAYIVDPRQLIYTGTEVLFGSSRIDLIYNRMTDFYMADHFCQHLKDAYLKSIVAITPNPRSHAIYANKRNLVYLSDAGTLENLGVPKKYIHILGKAIPKTLLVTRENKDELWNNRKLFFFKPLNGYGSKAAYRGDKLTKSAWRHITDGGSYIAQEFIAPGKRLVSHNNQLIPMKADVRNYVYDGKVQLTGARLYQGQTTNFRTPGGGFASVIPVAESFEILNQLPEGAFTKRPSLLNPNVAFGIH